ncbi:YkvA family protein [Methylophaga pinxianii]|uniref:YkvA family protein n=1 Tax=Methylophaga pinxianii TaxID=2881052 RepID=UPI001CF12CB8|nr:YkvA family protein [Methylophaga pinxianii]MCB2427468.1 DUF1232 domain-containing protein [Methylophaga pinxianii]UPH44749.1 YkvA family protein [Methylophaga pinxianii]
MTIRKLKIFAQQMKTQLTALYLASKHPAVPSWIKWMVIAVVAYALSPIDLIPDFIPVIGYLDELILLPFAIYIVVKCLPEKVWQECLTEAKEHRIRLPRNTYAASVIIICWVAIMSVVAYGLWQWLKR